MKNLYAIVFVLVYSFSSFSQNLDNTVWSFPPEKIAQLQGSFPGLDSVKIFFEFPDLFHTINYTNGTEATVFDGSYTINEVNNTGQVVDSTDGTTFCNPIDIVTFDYSVLDTVLTLSNVLSPTCSTWQIIIPGDYYLDKSSTTNSIKEQNELTFTIYPNPAADKIEFNQQIELIEIFDMTGKQILNLRNSKSVDIADISKGVYVIMLTQNGQRISKRLVVQ